MKKLMTLMLLCFATISCTFGQCDTTAHFISPSYSDIYTNEPDNCFEEYTVAGTWHTPTISFVADSETAVFALRPSHASYSVQGYPFQFWVVTDSLCDTIQTAVLNDSWIVPYTSSTAFSYGGKVSKYDSLIIGQTYNASIRYWIPPNPENERIGNLCLAYYSVGDFFLDIKPVVPAGRKVVGYYNLMGQEVEYRIGELLIIRYSDGSSEKVIYHD